MLIRIEWETHMSLVDIKGKLQILPVKVMSNRIGRLSKNCHLLLHILTLEIEAYVVRSNRIVYNSSLQFGTLVSWKRKSHT